MSMASPQRRGRLLTIQELLESQRETATSRCRHCGRGPDHDDRDHALVESALRARIRVLEARLGELGIRTSEA
jgi:hypothetical protein